jgi:hypothetical protein
MSFGFRVSGFEALFAEPHRTDEALFPKPETRNLKLAP